MPQQILLSLLFLFFLGLFSSCSVVQKVGLNTTAELVKGSSQEILTERNWELFKKAVPGNIKFIEGLLSVDPDNLDLLSTVVKSYSGYAYAVNETLSYEDKWKNQLDSSLALHSALSNYSKAVSHGLHYMKVKGVPYQDLQAHVRNDSEVLKYLDQHFAETDLDALFFLANAWGGLINLQKKNILLVAQLPIVKTLFDWVCTKKPDFHFGACSLFYGMYEVGRPKMLGGDPEKGRRIFLEAIKKYPENFLIRVTYLYAYVLPAMDEASYREQKIFLDNALSAWSEKMVWSPPSDDRPQGNQAVNLYNSVAKKRFELMKKYEKQFF